MVWVSIQGSSTPARLAMYWPRLKSVRYTLLFLATTRPGRGFALNKCEAIGAHAEPFEIGSRTLQVDLIAIAAYMGDLENRHGVRDRDLVSDPWHGRRLRGSVFLAGFGHDSRSLLLGIRRHPSKMGCDGDDGWIRHGFEPGEETVYTADLCAKVGHERCKGLETTYRRI
jgi:hypothetical protein